MAKTELIIPTPQSSVTSQTVLDEMVLHDLNRDVFIALNHTARIIWELCDGSRSIHDICMVLSEDLGYKKIEQQQVLLHDIETAVQQLHEHGFLELEQVSL